MKYLVTLYHPDVAAFRSDPDAFAKLSAEYREFAHNARAAGTLIEGGPVKAEFTSIRRRNGTAVAAEGVATTASPEMVGYYIFDVSSAEEAIETASQIPAARFGSVELRELIGP